MDLEKTLELMKKFGVRRLKTSELELELDLASPVKVEPAALGPISLPDEPTDEQLLLWSTRAYEGPTPGQSQEERLKVQAAAKLLDEQLAAASAPQLQPLEDVP